MPGTPNKNDPNYKEWWSLRPSPEQKAEHQKAVTDYLIAEEKGIYDLIHSVKLVKMMIPYVA